MAVAATAIVALPVSAAIGLGLLAPGRLGAAFSPATRARALLGLCILPALACALVMSAALAPSFGWIADHCAGAGEPLSHTHPHICEHHVTELPALSLLGLAGLLSARLTYGALSFGLALLRATRTRARLDRIAIDVESTEGTLRVLPLEAPQAFVVGWLRPSLYATEGLLSAAHREHLAAVLAHERAHLRRADGLRALIAGLALSFHLPFVARALRERLSRAQEMAADAEAAQAIGDRALIARALVHVARAQLRAPAYALSFGGGHIEQRVHGLLDERPLRQWPSSRTLFISLALASVLIALNAGAIHHAIEHALGYLAHG